MKTHAAPLSEDHPLDPTELLDALVADGRVEADRVAALRGRIGTGREAAGRHPLTLIAERNLPDARNPQSLLTLPILTAWLAERAALPLWEIDPLTVDVPAVTAVMSYAYAHRFDILAVKVEPDRVTVATAQPFVREWEKELGHVLQKEIVRVVANPDDIQRYLLEFYSLSRSVRGAKDKESDHQVGAIHNLEQLMDLGRRGKLDANDQHIVNIVDWLLNYAYAQRASDIHLEPRREQGNIRFRIDGVMHLVYQIPTSVMAAVTSRIKILGRMDLAEKRRPQDGRLKTRTPNNSEVELRLSTMPTAFGEKMVMRIFDPEILVKDYKALGFSKSEQAMWRQMIAQPHGIILVTGPTGSGKTTTLYTTLTQVARPEINVCTIEDPIEMVDPVLNQMQVQHNIGLDFASGVRTLLRQDPDIIMIGEIRDRETAEMAVQAALTGHLVFSTLHTNDAVAAVTRLQEIGVPAYLLKATVIGVLAQRLIRTLCPHCKAPLELDKALWHTLVHPWKAELPKQVYGPVGCLECRQTGYLGRVGLYEMLSLTPALKQQIEAEADVEKLRVEAIRAGMKPLALDGAQKVANGITTIEEVLKVVPPKNF
jgi:general secretion pathway protein E